MTALSRPARLKWGLGLGSVDRACLGGAQCTLHSAVGLRCARDLDMLLIALCYHLNLALCMRHIRECREILRFLNNKATLVTGIAKSWC